MELRQRDWLVRINGVDYKGFDISFQVSKSLRADPNSCAIRIYGMGAQHRAEIEALNIYDPKKFGPGQAPRKKVNSGRAPKKGNIRVELEAGYKGARGLIFRGDLRRGISKRDGNEIVMEIEGEDGGRSVLGSRISMSFKPGTSRLDVVKECAAAMGLGLGNILSVEPYLLDKYPHGTSVNGQASTLLAGVLRAAKVKFSVQNGTLQFQRVGAGLTDRGYLVSPTTGLIGSPERDPSGAIIVTTLMIPDIAPGTYFSLDSDRFRGTFLCRAVETSGDVSGQEWYHKIEAVPG